MRAIFEYVQGVIFGESNEEQTEELSVNQDSQNISYKNVVKNLNTPRDISQQSTHSKNLIISTQPLETGYHFPRSGGTALGIQLINNAPVHSNASRYNKSHHSRSSKYQPIN